MSMEWFRSYHGAPTDPKLAVIAKRSGCRRCEVVAVWWCLLDCASQCVTERRGFVTSFDIESIALCIDLEELKISSILSAMREKGMILENGMLAAWEKRQPKREDNSTERTREYRERQRTLRDADVTHGDSRVDKRREEKKDTPHTPRKRGNVDTPEFEEFWAAYPDRIGKAAARTAHIKALTKTDNSTLLAGLEAYKRGKPPDRAWCHPATWLNQERWQDRPAIIMTHPKFGSGAAI